VRREDFSATFAALDQRGYVPKTEVYERMRMELGFSLQLSSALIDDNFLSYPKFCTGFPNMMARLGVARIDAIFVGDHPEIDIRGARDAGIRAIWKRADYWGLVLSPMLSSMNWTNCPASSIAALDRVP
jgi:hypothetical protein